MWRAGAVANTLNVTSTQRLSVALVYLMALSMGVAVWWPASWLGTVVLALAVTVLNGDFYRYLAGRVGLWYTIRAVPLHWLYFGYCGLCVLWGTLLHCLTRARMQATA